MFTKRLREINARRLEIRALLEGEGEPDVDALTTELNDLEAEERSLIQRRNLAQGINQRAGETGGHGDRGDGEPDPDGITLGAPNPLLRAGAGDGYTPGIPATVDRRTAYLASLQGISASEAETRATRFAQEHRMSITPDATARALTLASGDIAQPTRVSGINPPPTEVSAIIDMVNVVDANGMGGDEVAYDAPDVLTAGVKLDDGTATGDTIQSTKVAKISPVLVTTLGYISRRIQRTTPLNYQLRTTDAAFRALRKQIGRLIIAGDPAAATPEITGILKAAAIQATSDIEIAAIDATTLRKIVLSYGGDDAVEGGGVLFLNKKDLIAFGDVRGTNEKKAIYEFTFDPGSTTTGTIKEGGLAARFCINNALPALADAASGAYTMSYGKPLAYQLNLFGPYDVTVSSDYKFAEGLLAVMGEVMVGGNVTTYNGFLRTKKA